MAKKTNIYIIHILTSVHRFPDSKNPEFPISGSRIDIRGAEGIPSQLVSFDHRKLPHLMTSKGGLGVGGLILMGGVAY